MMVIASVRVGAQVRVVSDGVMVVRVVMVTHHQDRILPKQLCLHIKLLI